MAGRPAKTTPFGADVDLERDDVRDSKSRRIDDTYADLVVERSRTVGRPSLTGPGQRSPHV